MSMKAQLRTDAKGNIIVQMEGDLHFDNHLKLKQELIDITDENPLCTVAIDMQSVDFVGSSGIGHFVETIRAINKNSDQIRLMNVKSEFLKVFKLFNLDAMELLFQEFEQDNTELLGQHFANRKRTFEN